MSDGIPIQPISPRGFIMLPQAPEDAGYYVYGNVHGVQSTGPLAQYAAPNLMTLILYVEREWKSIDDRKFGIGNISLAGGEKYEHHGHQKGIDMDCRAVRKDKLVGQAARCSRYDRAIYDPDATLKLICLFIEHPMVKLIYFNDDIVQRAIGGGRVKSMVGHNDHFHVELWERYA